MERYNFKLQVNQSYGKEVVEDDLRFSLRSFLVKLSLSKDLSGVLPRGMMTLLFDCHLVAFVLLMLRSLHIFLSIFFLHGRIIYL